jgi:hypothetical protein
LHSGNKCQLKGDEHRHHFLNPYDFEFWKKSAGSHYVWETKPPFQAEPMPGLAAFTFMLNRKGDPTVRESRSLYGYRFALETRFLPFTRKSPVRETCR